MRPRASQVNFDKTDISDPIIRLNSGQTGSNDKDSGIVIERGSDTNVAVIWDESADELAIINTTEDGSTSGNVTISSYANVRANAYYGDGSNLTGLSSYGDSDVASYLSANGYGTSSSIIASITDSAPGTLDTLNELAAALGDDANFSTTVTNSIATKLSLSGGTMTGNLTVSKTTPLIRLYDSNSSTGTYPAIEFDTANNQGVAIQLNEFDGELPVSGYGLVVKESSTNNQFPSTGTLSFNVLGDIYAGATSLSSLNKVWHAGNDGSGSGLDADTLDGMQPASTNTASTVVSRDGSGNFSAGTITATSTQAQYADLAEKYSTVNGDLPAGTAVTVGVHDNYEVTPASASDFCIGVVSTDPAYMMNSEADGQYIGLKGRLPVRVIGPVFKGQAVYAYTNGVCRTISTNALVGIALESNSNEEEKLVECVLKV